jgi:hypothetical protein
LIGNLNHGHVPLAKRLSENAGRAVHARRTISKRRAQFLGLGQPFVPETGRSAQQTKSAIRANPDWLFELNVVHF